MQTKQYPEIFKVQISAHLIPIYADWRQSTVDVHVASLRSILFQCGSPRNFMHVNEESVHENKLPKCVMEGTQLHTF